ncbi:YdcF family protein [Undibacterium jejuense]|uniref:YdcF family protein n=1 Tax=Undibacterium jejuense TaxID=1344949 RepID=A0A923KIE9_9BURK|nr:YdcF family protein [Undibacterium jejuense]MBC3862557.1 YdcF family protein [Undibacterium jejuense]
MSNTLSDKSPFVFLCFFVGVILVVDTSILMTRHNFGFGVTFPFCVGIALLGMAWQWQKLHDWLNQKKRRQLLWKLLWTGTAIWLSTVAAFFYFIQAGHDIDIQTIRQPVRTILVLGGGTRNCLPRPTLAERLDLAFEWAQRLPDTKLVVSGGQDPGEQCTEAQVMANYLHQRGLPENRLLQEGMSTNTFENLTFSKKIMSEHGINTTDGLLIITSDFHSVRSRQIALKAGFNNLASAGAETPLSVRYNSWLREYFSFVRGWIVGDY